jgi:hypothetical protein
MKRTTRKNAGALRVRDAVAANLSKLKELLDR